MSSMTKEIARWSREEVDALLQAWREGLTHKPAPLRRGKLNAYVSDRFHALRAAHEPFRTACSIVYKKKYWRSMAQFICDYNARVDEDTSGSNGNGYRSESKWFSLSQDERKRCFNKLKPTSYKFTDLEQDIVFEIVKLIALEDGTPDRSHLVYLSSASSKSDPRGTASATSKGRGDQQENTEYKSQGYQDSSRGHSPANTLPRTFGSNADAARRAPSTRKRRVVKHYDDSDNDEDMGESTTSSDGEVGNDVPEFHFPRTTISKPDTKITGSHQTFPEVEGAHFGSKVYSHQQHRQYQHEAQSATPDLVKIVDRLEAQAQELKAMVNQEREVRKQVGEQHEEHQQEWKREQEEHKRVLEKLRGSQQDSAANQQARQSEHAEWAAVLQQLQADRQERIRLQAARSKDQEERKTLLEEMKRNQDERQRMHDQWEVEREERATLLEQLNQEREAREQDDKEWRALLQQMKRDLAAKDEKQVAPEVKSTERTDSDGQGGEKRCMDDIGVTPPKQLETVLRQSEPAFKQGSRVKTTKTTDSQTTSKNEQIKAKPRSTFKEAVRRLSNSQVSGTNAVTTERATKAVEPSTASSTKATVVPKSTVLTIRDVNEGAEVLRVLRQSPPLVTGKRSRQAGGGKEAPGKGKPEQRNRVNRPRRV